MTEPFFTRGLVVGKFCPLHKGHELTIRRMLESCGQAIIISYTKPEFDGCPPALREHWLRELFPTATVLVLDDAILRRLCRQQHLAPVPAIPPNDAPAEEQRRFVGWLCLALLRHPVDAVFTSEDYGDGFAAELSRYFSQHLGRNFKVQHVCVDRDRRLVPVSGTVLRDDPQFRHEYLSPVVYRSLIRRVCFLGGESSGKTTMARLMAGRMGTEWAPEFGRELWELKQGRLEYEDMARIAATQLEREAEYALSANQWLFCDTAPLTTLFYSLEMFGRAEPQLVQMAGQSYQAVFLCAPDFDFVQDGTRREAGFRLQQHAWYVAELEQRQIPYQVLHGSIEARIQQVLACLEAPRP